LVRASGVGDFAKVALLLCAQEDPDTEEEEDLGLAAFLGRGAFFAMHFVGVTSRLSDEGRPHPLGLGTCKEAWQSDMVRRGNESKKGGPKKEPNNICTYVTSHSDVAPKRPIL
jgi:hypothetical protein